MDINLPDVLAEVQAVFARYEDALVNNRVDVLDELFWASAHTVRYGAAENLYGIDEIRAFRNARPAQGLARTLTRTVITTYGREGRWVTDASHALAFLAEGGTRRFRWDGSVTRTSDEPVDRRYVVHVTLRLSNRGKPDRPFTATPVFSGGRFDETYNERQAPVRFTPPEGTTRVELVTLITGHGFGAESSNCAEFCNHTHHFALDGAEPIVKTHEEANDTRGCARRVNEGVVPNQYGTWPFGRAGWCPGHDVPAWARPLPVRLGAENLLTYEAGLDGEIPYVPEVTMPDGYRAEIALSAWLVYYR